MTAQPGLAVRGLSCAVAGRTVLTDVELSAGAGDMVAVVGVNGSGKSTLLRTLAGLLAPVVGDVRVHGEAVHAMAARHRARRIAFVAQEEVPPADMLVTEYVALGRLPYRPPWARASDDRHRAVEALDRVGMVAAADRYCSDLSGGERRRVSLARGLAQDCDLLVLDEPTNHLDVRHQIELLELLRASADSASRIVVTAIHDLGLAAAYFDHVLVLDHGCAPAQGPPRDVLTSQTVRDVFGVQASCLTDDQGHEHLVVGPGRTPVPAPVTATTTDRTTTSTNGSTS